MESEYDITLNAGGGELPNADKSHFLESLGLGEDGSGVEPGRGLREAAGDEGVVLSSLPDHLGFSMAPCEASRNLSVSFSVARGSDRATPAAVPLPANETPEIDPEAPLSSAAQPPESVDAAAPEADGPDALLHLKCPDCDGSLVVKRRHLGVEGACVWCLAPIVAAASGRDGSVRVFPILGVRPAQTPVEADEPEPAKEPEEPEEPEEPASRTEESVAFTDETGPAAESAGAAAGEPEPASSSSSFSSSATVPAPTPLDWTGGNPAPGHPPDLDSLYDTGGFLPAVNEAPSPSRAPAEVPAASFGFSAPAAAVEASPSPELSGFAGFAPSAAASPEPGPSFGFTGPTPWGSPVRPPVAPASAPAPREGRASAGAGFLPDDEAPSPLPNESAPLGEHGVPTWEAAFGSVSEPAPAPDFDDGFAAFGSPFGTGSAGVKDGTPPWSMPSPGPSDEAPAVLAPLVPEVARETRTDSPFPPSPSPTENLLFGEVATAPSSFSALSRTPVPPPLLPGRPLPGTTPEEPPLPFSSIPVPAASLPFSAPAPAALPQAAPLPLRVKPKPKVRKGFLVLMVVILGFASGAALATFVLPVDRYVQAAREFMEAKFAPKPAVPVMPGMPLPEATSAEGSGPAGLPRP